MQKGLIAGGVYHVMMPDGGRQYCLWNGKQLVPCKFAVSFMHSSIVIYIYGHGNAMSDVVICIVITKSFYSLYHSFDFLTRGDNRILILDVTKLFVIE